MRPNSIRSEYEARAQRQRMSTFKRGAGGSIGPKILLAAVVVVAGVIGISGIYPQAIDAEWTQDSGTHLPKIPLLTASTTIKASATARALSLPHVVTTGQTAGSPPRPAPAPEVSPLGTSVAVVTPAPALTAAAPLALAEIPDAEAEAKAPATQPSPAKAVDKQTKVVKGKVAQHQQRSFSAAYAQYGGWGWFGFGGYRRF